MPKKEGTPVSRAAQRVVTRSKQSIREPSTWAAVAAIAAVVVGIDPGTATAIASSVGGAVESPDTWPTALTVLVPAILGIVLPEGGGKKNGSE